jgi:AraC-like DNA-binding protein
VVAPALVPVERAELESADPDEVEDLICRRYTNHRPRLLGDSREFAFRSRSATAGGLTVDRLAYAGAMAFETDPFAAVPVLHLLEGHMDVRGPQQRSRVGRGDSVLYAPDTPLDILLAGMTYEVVQFPLAALTSAVARLGLDPTDVRFEAMDPVSPTMNQHWVATLEYLKRCFAGPEPAASHPLLLAGAVEAAASAVLATFPNTTMTAERPPGPGRVDPAVARRAVDHIDEHAGEPVAVEDVAAAAGVGVRGLRAAFGRHRNTTPAAYLRRVRLERAHRDLQAADPARGDTVAAIAHRWGFATAARFATEYRRAYGQPPGRTLSG